MNTYKNNNLPCPCGSEQAYSACCARYLENEEIPATPEILMRSRYTAFTQGNAEYIGKTMKNEALKDYSAAATKRWALSLKWEGLNIVKAPPVPADQNTGTVHFIAKYFSENKPQMIEEISEFTKINDRWYYTKDITFDSLDEDVAPLKPIVHADKVGRNDPCLCGSGKKSKKCCAA